LDIAGKMAAILSISSSASCNTKYNDFNGLNGSQRQYVHFEAASTARAVLPHGALRSHVIAARGVNFVSSRLVLNRAQGPVLKGIPGNSRLIPQIPTYCSRP